MPNRGPVPSAEPAVGPATPVPPEAGRFRPRRLPRTALRVAGGVVAVLAIGLCVRTVAHQWNQIRPAIEHANVPELLLALVFSVASVSGLALLWRQVMTAFGENVPIFSALRWYFAGELGKYVPGGVWQVVGRGELASRGGVSRSLAYATTLVSMAVMCIGAAVTCGVLSPFLALDGDGVGVEMLLLLLLPLGLAGLHPAIFGRLLSLAGRVSGGRVDLQPPSWRRMCLLVLSSCPAWLLLGGASVLVTDALGLHQQPARVAFAAIAAWIVGFLAVPVPAGAGIRELVFVAICGLVAGPATAVAALARLLFVVTDAGCGLVGLTALRRAPTGSDGRPAGRPEARAGGHRDR